MKLSIIIINYNTGPLTRSLIESLLSNKLPARTEIIVVDNASSDESVSWLRSDFPEISVIDNRQNVGLAAGVNKGIANARGQYYLVLNPDMIALPGAVNALVKYMDSHKEVGVAGGKLLSPNGKIQYSCYRFYNPSTVVYRRTRFGKTGTGKRQVERFLMKDYDRKRARDVDWLMGACLIVRASAVTEVGGMDERFFLYFEDVDWCRRFWKAGWRVAFIPAASFSHFHQRSSEGVLFSALSNRSTREHIRSAVKYFWKYRGEHSPIHI